MSDEKKYYVYILRCMNDLLYTGITTDVSRRMQEHSGKRPSGAKFTRSHRPKRLESVWSCTSRSLALKLEARIKKLTRAKKERLIESGDLSVTGDTDSSLYHREYADPTFFDDQPVPDNLQAPP